MVNLKMLSIIIVVLRYQKETDTDFDKEVDFYIIDEYRVDVKFQAVADSNGER